MEPHRHEAQDGRRKEDDAALTMEERAREDERISFDQSKGRWTLELDDGTEMEFDDEQKAWVPCLDPDDVQDHQTAYSRPGVDASVPVERKRKAARDAPGAKKLAKRSSKDTSIYITGLGQDATLQQVTETFSRCGLVMEDIKTGEKKIKLYTDETGKVKGDALVTYFKEDSVALAIQILDDTELNYGSGIRMKVVKADFAKAGDAGKGKGERERERERPVKDKDPEERRRAQKRIEKLQSRLADWSDEDDAVADDKPDVPRVARLVILKGIFSPQEIKDDPSLLLDLGQEVRDECEKFGSVTNVTIYDLEPEGVVGVKYQDQVAAQACIIKMHQRWFGGRQLVAEFHDPKIRYKKSDAGKYVGDGNHQGQDEKKRLEDFATWLEGGPANGAQATSRESLPGEND